MNTWLLDLSAIASLGSAVALILFTMVSVAHLRLRRGTGARASLLWSGLAATLAALLAFATTTLAEEPRTLVALVSTLLLALVLEFTWGRVRRRREQL